MSDEEFEQLVNDGIARIPEHFLKQLKNVVVTIADLPTKRQLKEQGLGHDDGYELLGLYEGIPQTSRGEYYGIGELILPDKITIFKLPILEESGGDPARVRDVVRDTVWHEVGHYFGWDDEELHKREDEGTNHSG
jgi:predicted Zn-dependent protease with MMP-like domain